MSNIQSQKVRDSSASLRKMKKPLIEKRRRDRINKSLSQLRNLLLDHMKRTGVTQVSKLDKADILEMAVSYVKLTRFEEAEVAMATKRQYKSGYISCARAALKCMDESMNVNQTVKSNLKTFLTERCDRVCNSESNNHNQISYQHQPIREPISVEIPTTSFPDCSRQTLHAHNRLGENVLTFADDRNTDVLNNHSSRVSARYFNERKSHNTLNVLEVSRKDNSSAFTEIKFHNSLNVLEVSGKDNSHTLTERKFHNSLNVLEVTDNSHALNLSAADSSFNGDVWRSW